MNKIYSKIYHLKGSGTTCGTMVCSQCQKKIDSYGQDWLEAKKNTDDGDWGYVSWHRKCCKDQKGWEKIEEEIERSERIVQEVMEYLGTYRNEHGDFGWEFYEALSRMGLEVE